MSKRTVRRSPRAARALCIAGFELARTRIGHGPDLGRAGPGARGAALVCLRDGAGRAGWGEAAPLAGTSPESLEEAARAIEEVAPRLSGFELRPGASFVGEIDRALAPFDSVLCSNPSARFALETALLDLGGEALEESAAALLRASPPLDRVAVNGVVDAAHADAEGDACAQAAAGVAAIKVKVGASGEAGWARELTLARRLRALLPATCALRLDANGAWSVPVARKRLREVAELVAFVEQPVAVEQLLDLGDAGGRWAADESLAVPGLAERLLADSGCAVFVLKPHRLGLVRSLELARRAHARGMRVVVTHLFDGPIGLAAACELALALPAVPLPCGLMPHDPLTRRVPQLATSGVCRRVSGHGLCLRSEP